MTAPQRRLAREASDVGWRCSRRGRIAAMSNAAPRRRCEPGRVEWLQYDGGGGDVDEIGENVGRVRREILQRPEPGGTDEFTVDPSKTWLSTPRKTHAAARVSGRRGSVKALPPLAKFGRRSCRRTSRKCSSDCRRVIELARRAGVLGHLIGGVEIGDPIGRELRKIGWRRRRRRSWS